MSGVPKWESVPLSDLAALKTGPFGSALHRSDYVLNGTPVVNPTHIVNGRIVPGENARVGAEVLRRLVDFKLTAGDVILGRRGEMGRCAVAGPREDGWLCGTGSLIVRSYGALDPRYLQRFLSSPEVVKSLEGDAVGSTMVNLNQGILRELQVPLPPIPEQKRIADKLDALLARVDACRERLDRVPGILKRFRQAVLAAATSGELTREWREERGLAEDWPLVELGSVTTEFSYGTAAKSAKVGKVPVLRMGNIQDGELDWTDLVFTSDAGEIAKYKLSAGDVLFNRTNSPELVGKSAVFHGGREAVYAGYLIRIRCGYRLLPGYLNLCLESPAGRDYCWRVKSDGVSQSNINAKKLAAFSFGLPSIDEQKEIVRRVGTLLTQKGEIWSRVETTARFSGHLTASVLVRAFRGELVPQDPNDEPAAELLARIRGAAGSETIKPRRGRRTRELSG